MRDTLRLVEVAAGRAKAELVFKNANVINVFTAEIIQGDVAVDKGYIAGVGQYSGRQEIDCTGKYICPGFIDAHIHIESTLLMPSELVKLSLPSGTTTMIADPHEIVNVTGSAGMQFMLDASENLPCDFYFMLPSSVPATAFETSGADFTAEDMQVFLNHPRVLGLGEVMCFPDVVGGRGDIFSKLKLMEGMPIDGHAPGLSGNDLQAYAAAGVMTEHEAVNFEEAKEKAQAGFAVLVREGSAAHNLYNIVEGLVESGTPCDRFMFCTDDKHIEDIKRDGHIRWNVKMAVDIGMDPVQAIRMASWNAAQAYGFKDKGAVAAGYKADIVILQDLKEIKVEAVYKNGVDSKELINSIRPFQTSNPVIMQSMKNNIVHATDLRLEVSGETDVIEMVPYQLTTKHLKEQVPCENGLFAPDSVYSKLAVIERHGKNGNISIAPLKGYGLSGGAIATSVAHDSHNIIAAGDSDADIALAVNRLKDIGGGYVLVQNGALAGEVPLCVAGLMSTHPSKQVLHSVSDILKKAYTMGVPYYLDPFISLSFLALPVIPSIRLTDKGLFDVDSFKMIR